VVVAANLLVAVLETFNQLGHVVSGQTLGERFHFDIIGQRASSTKLHHEEHILFILQYLMQLHNAGMVKHHHGLFTPGGHNTFSLSRLTAHGETRRELRHLELHVDPRHITDITTFDDFDGFLFTSFRIDGQANHTIGPASEFPFELILADPPFALKQMGCGHKKLESCMDSLDKGATIRVCITVRA